MDITREIASAQYHAEDFGLLYNSNSLPQDAVDLEQDLFSSHTGS